MDYWLAPVLGLIGALLGAAFSPWATTRLAAITRRRELFDSAISAVRAAQLTRHYVPGLPPQLLRSFTDSSGQQLNERIAASGLERHLDAMHAARLALAALEPFYVPTSWNKDVWEISEDDAESLLGELKRARR